MSDNQELNATVMKLYAAIANQSHVMLDAAKQGDWEALCDAETDCSRLIRELQAVKQAREIRLNAEERHKHITYIKNILADDAEIRNITEPRLRQLEEFLRATSNTHRLSNTYGST